MQQDGVESLQSDRESLKEKLCLLIIGRVVETDMILRPRSFKNYTSHSFIGPKVSKAIGWNTYDPDNAAHLACFLDAAISAAAPAEGAEAEM